MKMIGISMFVCGILCIPVAQDMNMKGYSPNNMAQMLQQQMRIKSGLGGDGGSGFGQGFGMPGKQSSLGGGNFNQGVEPTAGQSKQFQPQINHQLGTERGEGKLMGLGIGSEIVPRLGAMGAGLPVPTGSSNGLAGGGIEWTCAGIAKTDFGWKCTEYGRPKWVVDFFYINPNITSYIILEYDIKGYSVEFISDI
jgi:hypothetical protein